MACPEQQHLAELQTLAHTQGLGLDGLVVEGGEPQLRVVRELQRGWALRCGWLSCEDAPAFTAFSQPTADLDLCVQATMQDKHRGSAPAVQTVFSDAKQGFCQAHYFQNAVAPVVDADEQMTIALRQAVREEVGDLIRQNQAETPEILRVTGLLPFPLPVATSVLRTPPPLWPGPGPQGWRGSGWWRWRTQGWGLRRKRKRRSLMRFSRWTARRRASTGVRGWGCRL
jgi:hypothetical protein